MAQQEDINNAIATMNATTDSLTKSAAVLQGILPVDTSGLAPAATALANAASAVAAEAAKLNPPPAS